MKVGIVFGAESSEKVGDDCDNGARLFYHIEYNFQTLARLLLKHRSMMMLTSLPDEGAPDPAVTSSGAPSGAASCYSITVFTQCWKDVRNFYVNILRAHVVSERAERYSEIELGGVPLTIRMAEHGETVSYFHLYVSMKNHESVLSELRRRGIIVTTVGPYTNFRDPEGRVIKLSEEKTIVS